MDVVGDIVYEELIGASPGTTSNKSIVEVEATGQKQQKKEP